MKDSLKDFVNSNREGFDHREPSPDVWNRIESTLPQMKSRSLWNSVVVWRVAAALFLTLSVYLIYTRPVVTQKRSELTSLSSDFNDQEMFYSDQIAEKVALIDDLDNAYEDDQFTQDFQKLEAMYSVLREEMKAKPSQKVKDALILNMLVRIDLLNQQIKRLEDANKKNRSKESSI